MRGSASRQNDGHNQEFTKLYMMTDQSLHRLRNPSFTMPYPGAKYNNFLYV